MLYCFLDTNIFEQYQTFDEIDWPKEVGASEVCLVIPKRVIQELDKHKDDPTRDRVRNRARTALKKIEEYDLKPNHEVRAHTTILVETVSPSADWLKSFGYDPDIPDDVIVGSVHYFKLSDPSNEAILFAGDTGARLKARANNVDCIIPSDNLRLPPEPDPAQQQIQRLQRENERLKYSQPILEMTIENLDGERSNIIDFAVDFNSADIYKNLLQSSLDRKFKELEYREPVDGEYNHDTSIMWQSIGKKFPTRARVNNYHEKLADYVRGPYYDYLVRSKLYKQFRALACSLKLVLENTGSKQAQNIDLWLFFPNGLRILGEQLSEIEEPLAPDKPKPENLFGSDSDDFLSTSLEYLSRANIGIDFPVSASPILTVSKSDNGYTIHWGQVELKHFHTLRLPELYLLFDPINQESTGFNIRYEITANDMIEKVEGKLVIRVTRK